MSLMVPEFGRLVRKRLVEKQLTPNQVMRISAGKVSHTTVQQMRDGVVPGPEKVLAFALALEDEPDLYLGKAGFPFRYDPKVIEDAAAVTVSDRRGSRVA